jgi:hypothetical protein
LYRCVRSVAWDDFDWLRTDFVSMWMSDLV